LMPNGGLHLNCLFTTDFNPSFTCANALKRKGKIDKLLEERLHELLDSNDCSDNHFLRYTLGNRSVRMNATFP
jgi:hypothetical protein